MRNVTRWTAVPVATLLIAFGSVLAPAPAQAADQCSPPATVGGVGAGVFTDSSSSDQYWSHTATGRTTFSLTGVGRFVLEVYTACGTFVCAGARVCTTNTTGPLVIHISTTDDVPTAYVLSATSGTTATPPCEEVDTAGVCVSLVTGPVLEQETVYGVTTTPVATHTVGGWVDAYRFPLPTGGSAVVPCVVLAVNATDGNPCETAGGTFVSRAATLVTQSVDQPAPVQGAALATVRVCDATLTATVNGFGIEDVPVYSVC